MKKRRSDKELTFALCVSLALHTLFVALLIHEKVEMLLRELAKPAQLADSRKLPKIDEAKEETPEPPSILIQPKTEIIPEFDPPRPPPPEKPKAPKKPSDVAEENIEWGERNGKGIAITSAPGKEPLSARKGIEDQASASRDPEGPVKLLDDPPSPSTALPGENGDGSKSLKDLLAGKGTEGTPEMSIGKPDAPVIPPAPVPQRPAVATADSADVQPEATGPSTSQQPAPEKRTPAQANVSPAHRDGLPNDPARPNVQQILPIKQPEMIGIRSNDPAYPEIVQALTQPPGVKLDTDESNPIQATALPELVAPDVTSAPVMQPATAALETRQPTETEMAQRIGDSDPAIAPPILEAMVHPPGEVTRIGGAAMLPEIALPDKPGGPALRDAISALTFDEPRAEELAQAATQGEPIPTPAAPTQPGPSGATASAQGGVPGPPTSAADPAPDTGLESDPFAKIPGVDFHDGKVEARSGREVKPIRPRLGEAGRRDLLARQFPTLVFKVRIDKSGKVTDVSVVQGSGSEAIDMPVYRALWEWWFEPPRDKKGNPLEDVQLVSIHWG